jgi:hypothetical protein
MMNYQNAEDNAIGLPAMKIAISGVKVQDSSYEMKGDGFAKSPFPAFPENITKLFY